MMKGRDVGIMKQCHLLQASAAGTLDFGRVDSWVPLPGQVAADTVAPLGPLPGLREHDDGVSMHLMWAVRQTATDDIVSHNSCKVTIKHFRVTI